MTEDRHNDSIALTVPPPKVAADFMRDIKSSAHSALTCYYASVGTKTPKSMHRLVLSEVEPALIMATLQYTEGNQSRAARILGVSRRWFLLRCAYYHIHLDPTRPDGYALGNTE